MNATNTKKEKTFNKYEVFLIAILAFLQFTIILDFMLLSPLGTILMPILKISTQQFGYVVAAYALSAAVSGLLAAGFADKFDRKKMLLFFYTGFILGTLLCGMANSYAFLMGARIVTGIFGGVIGSIGFAIITDIFEMKVRGRVMGFVQMAFSASQILGIPFGFYLANHYGWHLPFLLIVGVSVLAWVLIATYMKPVNAHLKLKVQKNAFQHLLRMFSTPRYLQGYAATVLLTTGGFMLMPFGSDFSTHNLGVSRDNLLIVYVVTGICSMIAGPFVGSLSDKLGKFKIFVAGSLLSGLIVAYYGNLGVTPLWIIITLNSLMFVGVTSRIIASSALMSAVPAPQDRGAFMGVNSSIQQFSGGIAAIIAGHIVVKAPSGELVNYYTLCYTVVGTMLVSILLMYLVNRMIDNTPAPTNHSPQNPPVVEPRVAVAD